jgi:HEAT repeat protein
MGKTRRIFLFVLAGIFFAGFAWLLLTPREPVYQGKTLSVWLEEANESQVTHFESANPAAVNAIRQIGTKALPELLRLAATKDVGLRQVLLDLNEKQSSISFKVRPKTKCLNMAAMGFYALGSDARSCVPRLTLLLSDQDSETRSYAAWYLGFIGPAAKDAVPVLIASLKTNHLDTDIFSSSFALGKIGPEANPAVPVLRLIANNPSNWFTQAFGQAALVQVGGDSLLPFINQLKDTSNPTNWNRAAFVVGNCPNEAEPAIPLLIAALSQTNRLIQSRAFASLGLLHRDADICVPAIASFLNSTNDYTRQASLVSLRQYGTASKPAISGIIPCLADADGVVRKLATNALRDIDSEAAAKFGIK